MFRTQQKKKDKFHIGTINKTDLWINRKGKTNSGLDPGLNTKVHKSKRDYNRSMDKLIIQKQIQEID